MKKRILIILAGITGIVILTLIFLPEIARRYAVNHGKEYIGRQFKIEKIRLNYFTSTVKIIGFALFEKDEKEVFISFDTLLVNLQPLNLLRNELVVEKVHLTGLFTQIIQKDSTFNFDDIVDFLSQPADSVESDTAPPKPLRFRMSDLRLNHARFIFDDRNVGKTTQLSDFSLAIPFIAWNQQDKSEAGVRFSLARDGYFESSLRIDPQGGDFQADISIRRLYLDAFSEYAAHYSNMDSVAGVFSSDIDITGNINSIEESLISGNIDILDLALMDSPGHKFLGAGQLKVGLKNIDIFRSRFEIDTILLAEPYVRFILNDSTNNLSEIFRSPEKAQPSARAVPDDSSGARGADALYYSVEAIILDRGVIEYTDNLTGEPFNYYLSGIRLESDSINSDAEWISLYSSMLLNKRGTLNAEVGFNPVDPLKNIRLNYVISDFLLSDLNIYSRYYMGLPVILGDMYYRSETEITNGQLESENKLVMTDVKLGEKGRALYDLPIKLALFILKDRNGVINLDVPVRGDLNDPKIRLGRIIWNTFKNLIVKLATAPYDALAAQVGADPGDLEAIAFDYLDTALTARRQLDLLLELEQMKEGLSIELVYFNDREKEREALVAMEGLSDEEAITRDLDSLAWYRKNVLETYLLSQKDSTAIKFSVSNPDDPENVGSLPRFKIKYSLEESE